MQNWEHIHHIFSHLNLIPQDSHGCDFSRIRNWYLDGEAKYLRQTLVFTEFITPEINALFTHHMNNIGGKAKFLPSYSGVLADIGTPINHVSFISCFILLVFSNYSKFSDLYEVLFVLSARRS